MKYIQRKTVLLGSVLGVAVGLFAGALVLGERLSPPVSGLCFGVAGILGGVAGSRLIMARVERKPKRFAYFLIFPLKRFAYFLIF